MKMAMMAMWKSTNTGMLLIQTILISKKNQNLVGEDGAQGYTIMEMGGGKRYQNKNFSPF